MPDLPDWQPLGGWTPPPPAEGAGRVIAVVATEEAVREGWDAPAALELARHWGEAGQRIVLVDAVLNRPSLHVAAGIDGREGITDAVLHGASLGRVSTEVEGGFFLIPAGTPVADVGEMARDPRWFRIIAGMGEAGATMVLFLRDGESGTTGFLGSASDIVVLAGPGSDAPGSIRDMEPLVRSVTGPGAPGPGATGPGSTTRRAPLVAPVDKGAVGRRTSLLVLLAIVAAALLGWLLTSGLG